MKKDYIEVGGFITEKEKREGALGKTTLSSSSPLPWNRGGRRWGAAMGRRPLGLGGTLEEGENREGDAGIRFPCLPRAEAACGGGAAVAGGW